MSTANGLNRELALEKKDLRLKYTTYINKNKVVELSTRTDEVRGLAAAISLIMPAQATFCMQEGVQTFFNLLVSIPTLKNFRG